MLIEYKKVELTEFGEIPVGGCFVWRKNHYIKIDPLMGKFLGEDCVFTACNLERGHCEPFENKCKVFPLDAKITITTVDNILED